MCLWMCCGIPLSLSCWSIERLRKKLRSVFISLLWSRVVGGCLAWDSGVFRCREEEQCPARSLRCFRAFLFVKLQKLISLTLQKTANTLTMSRRSEQASLVFSSSKFPSQLIAKILIIHSSRNTHQPSRPQRFIGRSIPERELFSNNRDDRWWSLAQLIRSS